MSGHDFDALTRSLAAGKSRRSVLRGLAGALVALVAGRVTQDSAAATVRPCHGYGGNCTTSESCCQTEPSTCNHGKCCPTALVCGASCCLHNQSCVNGSCQYTTCHGYGGNCTTDASCCQTEAST